MLAPDEPNDQEIFEQISKTKDLLRTQSNISLSESQANHEASVKEDLNHTSSSSRSAPNLNTASSVRVDSGLNESSFEDSTSRMTPREVKENSLLKEALNDPVLQSIIQSDTDNPEELAEFPKTESGIPKVMIQPIYEGLLSSLRGFRNGVIAGARIRLPYIIQAFIYAVLFRQAGNFTKLRFTIKQMFQHGCNLGLYVGIYKLLCNIMRRNLGGPFQKGLESVIAGFVGGYIAFGESKGVSGAVNNQIVLYLFARGIEGSIRSAVDRGVLPKALDIRTPGGFRLFAGFSLALILYLTEYESSRLRKGFMRTMDVLYYDSNMGPVVPKGSDKKFSIVIAIVSLSLVFGSFVPSLSLSNLFQLFDDYVNFSTLRKFIPFVN